MNDQELFQEIEETKSKLSKKINSISSVLENGNEKVTMIKSKTIEVLNNALNMFDSIDFNNVDAQEIKLSLETVDNKSRLLFENALNKIEQLKKEETLNNETINNFSKAVDKTNIEIEDMNVKPEDDVSLQAIEILKSWLMPEGD